MFLFILIFSLCFIIFIELYFGSIVFRPNDLNQVVLNIPSIIHFIFHPLRNSFLWNPQVIIGNYPFMLTIGILMYAILYDK